MKFVCLFLLFLFSKVSFAQQTTEKIFINDFDLSDFFQQSFDYKAARNYSCNDFITDIFFLEFELDKNGGVKNEHINRIALPHLRPIFLRLIKQTNGKWNKDFQKIAKNKSINIPVYYSFGECNRDTSAKARISKDSSAKIKVQFTCCDVMSFDSKRQLSVKESLKRVFEVEGIKKKKLKYVIFLPFIFIEDDPKQKGVIM